MFQISIFNILAYTNQELLKTSQYKEDDAALLTMFRPL